MTRAKLIHLCCHNNPVGTSGSITPPARLGGGGLGGEGGGGAGGGGAGRWGQCRLIEGELLVNPFNWHFKPLGQLEPNWSRERERDDRFN